MPFRVSLENPSAGSGPRSPPLHRPPLHGLQYLLYPPPCALGMKTVTIA